MFSDFNMVICNPEELQMASQFKADNYAFKFGDQWCYVPSSEPMLSNVKPILEIGEYHNPYAVFPYLGIHGKYEVSSGTGGYDEWVKRADHLGIDTLGICEKHTLGGTLPFQRACEKKGITPIIGWSCDVLTNDRKTFSVKLYVNDEYGWKNVLALNRIAGESHGGLYITIQELVTYAYGLTLVVTPSTESLSNIGTLKGSFGEYYWQYHTNEFALGQKDQDYLESLSIIMSSPDEFTKLVILTDYYTRHKHHAHIHEILRTQGGVKGSETVKDGYMRSVEEEFGRILSMFKQEDGRWQNMIAWSNYNLANIVQKCQYRIDTNSRNLPEYEMNPNERVQFATNMDLFTHLIQEGYMLYAGKHYDAQTINDRVMTEWNVVVKHDFVDYFLILWDICRFCREQGIQYGPGRGSAAGSIIAYMLQITWCDPLEHGLLFERFLNEGRLGNNALPDIDVDFNSERRDEVFNYLKNKYGHDYCARVGTYGQLKLRGALTEMNRYHGVTSIKDMRYITKVIEDENNGKWSGVLVEAERTKKIRKFIQENPMTVADANACFNDFKSTGIHACAFIIFPKYKGTMFEQVPVRYSKDAGYITEWEGGEMEKAGYLKEDLLVTVEMTKLEQMCQLVEQCTGSPIAPRDIPTDSIHVYDRFKLG